MIPEYGPGRAIPHPILFRLLDSEADDLTVPTPGPRELLGI